ncbi:ATP synthase F1 subunit gamma [Patescibacteria group bacterium]|nr:ATP synthase F1 subunit gamma [Patescibacteria group bacterium]
MNTRDIKRRMKSIENTRQITRAMEMVAATKMRKAQQAVVGTREYAERAQKLLVSVSAEAAQEHIQSQPLLEKRPVKKVAYVVVGSDRGLCGAMNTNTVKAALESDNKAGASTFISVGRKSEQALRGKPLVASFKGLGDLSEYREILPIAGVLIDEFIAGNVDKIVLVYPEFVSTLVNKPRVETLLPAELPEDHPKQSVDSAQTLYEPSAEAVLESLLPRLLEIRLYQALLETKASEHSARMLAMRNASNNAGDLLEELKFSYNQARQAAITQEIAEISAASAAA